MKQNAYTVWSVKVLFVSRVGSNLCLTIQIGVLIRHEAIEMLCAPQSREPLPQPGGVLGALVHCERFFYVA